MRITMTLVGIFMSVGFCAACAGLDLSGRVDDSVPRHVPRAYHAPALRVQTTAAPPVIRPVRAATEADLPQGISCGLVRMSARMSPPDSNKPVLVQIREGAAARGMYLTELQAEAIASCLEK